MELRAISDGAERFDNLFLVHHDQLLFFTRTLRVYRRTNEKAAIRWGFAATAGMFLPPANQLYGALRCVSNILKNSGDFRENSVTTVRDLQLIDLGAILAKGCHTNPCHFARRASRARDGHEPIDRPLHAQLGIVDRLGELHRRPHEPRPELGDAEKPWSTKRHSQKTRAARPG
jgi:hypothetical protein